MEYSRNSNNKKDFHKTTNNLLFDREMGNINVHYKNLSPINRLEIEREEFLKNSLNDEDRPMLIHNTNPTKINFKNVSSFETNNDFADVNADTRLSDNLQNNITCINGINNFSLFLFDNMLKIMNGAFVYCPFLIYTIFASLYISSNGNTEIELKNYFNYPRNDIITKGLKEIIDSNQKNNNLLGNCIIFSDELDYNPNFFNNINYLSKMRKVNKQNYQKEAFDINNIIEKISRIEKKSISPENIKNSNIILLNYANINPTWTSYFSKTTKENNIEFMHAFNQTFGFYEQQNLQVLEISSIEDYCFGIIYGDIELNDKNFKFITNSLKPTLLEEVKIPKFKLQTKLRYTNLLKETDLKTVFLDLNCPNLFKNQCEINDCLQNIQFNLSEKSINNKKNIGFKTSKKFIVQQSFRFYLRTQHNNCIILLGTY